MIRTVAELLREFFDETLPLLDAHDVRHAPTIGDMYEGLSAQVLHQGIPSNLGLVVGTGFATDGHAMSGQLDVVIARGPGDPIPFTDSRTWHVKDIIAVLEVKKTLYSASLADALSQLASVRALELKWSIENAALNPSATVDVGATRRIFAQMTGRICPPFEELTSLPVNEELIFHSIFDEQFSIVRIVLGLHGFTSEINFRKAMVKILKDNQGAEGFGPSGLPQAIVSGNFSLVKANGRPYVSPVVDGKWPFLSSTGVNPLLILLELIWTRLDGLFEIGNPWGDDREVEVMHGLLSGVGVESDGRRGWEIYFSDPSADELARLPSVEEWAPSYLDVAEFTVLNMLCAGREVDVNDPKLLAMLAESGTTIDALRANLVSSRLVALDGRYLRIIAVACATGITPAGDFVAGDDNTGRFTRWMLSRGASQSGS